MGDKYIRNIEKSFEDILVLDEISMNFKKEKITCILGPSGCGKSTLLNILTGIIKDYKGEVVGFSKEEISFIFQEDRLIPWLNVYDNIRLILKRKYTKKEIDNRITDYLSMVKMENYMCSYPSNLSGGMKQRVSIVRALAYGGNIIIMDEPFKSLDIKNKTQLLKDFKKISIRTKSTVVFVTHNIDEAIEIGDTIYVLSDKPSSIINVWENINKENVNKDSLRKEIVSAII